MNSWTGNRIPRIGFTSKLTVLVCYVVATFREIKESWYGTHYPSMCVCPFSPECSLRWTQSRMSILYDSVDVKNTFARIEDL